VTTIRVAPWDRCANSVAEYAVDAEAPAFRALTVEAGGGYRDALRGVRSLGDGTYAVEVAAEHALVLAETQRGVRGVVGPVVDLTLGGVFRCAPYRSWTLSPQELRVQVTNLAPWDPRDELFLAAVTYHPEIHALFGGSLLPGAVEARGPIPYVGPLIDTAAGDVVRFGQLKRSASPAGTSLRTLVRMLDSAALTMEAGVTATLSGALSDPPHRGSTRLSWDPADTVVLGGPAAVGFDGELSRVLPFAGSSIEATYAPLFSLTVSATAPAGQLDVSFGVAALAEGRASLRVTYLVPDGAGRFCCSFSGPLGVSFAASPRLSPPRNLRVDMTDATLGGTVDGALDVALEWDPPALGTAAYYVVEVDPDASGWPAQFATTARALLVPRGTLPRGTVRFVVAAVEGGRLGEPFASAAGDPRSEARLVSAPYVVR
jgi:hypothetical protein